jgi:hypothetical protein
VFIAAPALSPEGTTITLVGQFIMDPKQPFPGELSGLKLLWTVTHDGAVLPPVPGSFKDPTFQLTPLDIGEYDVRLDIFGDQGYFRGPATAAIDVFSITGLPAGPVTEGTPIELGTQGFNPDIIDIQQLSWLVTRDGVPFARGSGPTFRFTPDDEGTYAVTLAATDRGNLDTQTVTVVNAVPTANAGPDQSVPLGSAVTLAGSYADPGTGDGHTWTWRVFAANGQLVASGSHLSLTFTPPAAGTYTAVFTAGDDDGVTGSDTALISVTQPVGVPLPNPPIPVGGLTSPGPAVPPGALPLPPGPPTPAVPPNLLLVGNPGTALVTPRAGGDDGSGPGTPPIGRAPGGTLLLTAPLWAGSSPIVASEVVTLALDPAAERAQNLLPADTGLGRRPTPEGGEDGADDGALRHDHVKTKVLQTVASVTVEDDSVGIVEAVVGSQPGPSAGPGVGAATPPAGPEAPARAAKEPEAAPRASKASRAWHWLAGAVIACTSWLAGPRLERRRHGPSLRDR